MTTNVLTGTGAGRARRGDTAGVTKGRDVMDETVIRKALARVDHDEEMIQQALGSLLSWLIETRRDIDMAILTLQLAQSQATRKRLVPAEKPSNVGRAG